MKYIYNLRAVLALFISLCSVSAWAQAPTSKPVILGNATICPSLQTYSMSADPNGEATSYVWETPFGTFESDSRSIDLDFTSPGTYDITAWYRNADGDGPKADVLAVEVKSQPSVTLAPIPQVCVGEEVTFEAVGNGAIDTYEWSSSLGDSQKGVSPNFTMNLTGDATITVSTKSNISGCLSAVTSSNVSPKNPTIALVSSSAEKLEQFSSYPLLYVQHLCGDETVTFTETGDEAGTLTWTWVPSDTPASNVIKGDDLRGDADILQVAKDAGCSSPLLARVSFDLQLLPDAQIAIQEGGDSVLCTNDNSPVTLFSGESNPSYSYKWSYQSIGEAWSDYSSDVGVIEVVEPGSYKVLIEKEWGCKAEGAVFFVDELDVDVGLPHIIELDRTMEPYNQTVEVVAEELGSSKGYNYKWGTESGNGLFTPDNSQVVNLGADKIDQVSVVASLANCQDTAYSVLFVYTPNPTSVQGSMMVHENLYIFPNPVESEMFFSNAMVGKLEVYNMQGMVVLECNVEGDSVDISELPAGTYVVTLGNLTQRIEVR